MRSLLTVIAILTLSFALPSVEGKTEVLIYLDKEEVSVGEYIRIAISVTFEKPSPIEILISGKSDALWLCKNESKVSNLFDGCNGTSWNVKIPENWESGDYHVKVNIYDGSTLEFSKTFKVIRPKIVEVKVPELVYQGKKEVTVKAEVADPSKAKLNFRLFGLNSRLDFQSDFDKDGVAKFAVNTRNWQGEPLKPGYYVAELKLFYEDKLFDSRSLTVEIVNPKLVVSFSEEIKSGETLRVEVSTNRDGDAEYSGIFIVLVGKNYKRIKHVELDKDGKAIVAFETAGLDEGYYTIYARDTSLTLRNIDLRNFSESYYALNPSDSNAKLFYAHDDVLVFKTLRIVKEKNFKQAGFLIFEPSVKELNCKETSEFDVFLLNLPTGISNYELRFFVLNHSVAQISGLSTPSWASDVYRAVFNESARVKALDIENKVQKAEKLLIAKVRLLGISEGSTEINADVIQLSDDKGNSIVVIPRNALISVTCKLEDNFENNTTEDLANETRNEEIGETKEERKNSESQSLEPSESEKSVSSKETLNRVGEQGKIPKPKKLEIGTKDLFLALTASFAFATTLLRKRVKFKG